MPVPATVVMEQPEGVTEGESVEVGEGVMDTVEEEVTLGVAPGDRLGEGVGVALRVGHTMARVL